MLQRAITTLTRLGSRTLLAGEIIALVLTVKSCTDNTASPTAEDGGGGAGGEVVGGAGGEGGAADTTTTTSSSTTSDGGAGGATTTTSTGGAGGSTCEPYTCGSTVCGTWDDGCGSMIECGPQCPSGQVCATWCRCEYEPQPPDFGLCKNGTVAAYCGGAGVTLPAGCTLTDKIWNGKPVSCCPAGQTQ